MSTSVCKLKIVVPVKAPSAKEDRMASLSAVFGPKGIKAIDILKRFDNEIEECKYEPGTPIIVKVDVIVNKKTGKTEDYKIHIGTPSISYYVKKSLGITSCSSKPGSIITKQVDEEFVKKIVDLKIKNADDEQKARLFKSVVGSLRSMGIKYVPSEVK